MISPHPSFEDLRDLMQVTSLGRSLLRRHGEDLLPRAWNLLHPRGSHESLPEALTEVSPSGGEPLTAVAEALWRGAMDLEALQARPDNLLLQGTPEERLQVTLLARHGVPVLLHPSSYAWRDEAFRRERALLQEGVDPYTHDPLEEGEEPSDSSESYVPLVAAFHLQEESWREVYQEGEDEREKEGLAALLVFADGGARRYRLPASLATMKALLQEVPLPRGEEEGSCPS